MNETSNDHVIFKWQVLEEQREGSGTHEDTGELYCADYTVRELGEASVLWVCQVEVHVVSIVWVNGTLDQDEEEGHVQLFALQAFFDHFEPIFNRETPLSSGW